MDSSQITEIVRNVIMQQKQDMSLELAKTLAERVEERAEEPVCALGIGEALSSMAEVMPLNQLLDRLKVEVERQLVDGGEK